MIVPCPDISPARVAQGQGDIPEPPGQNPRSLTGRLNTHRPRGWGAPKGPRRAFQHSPIEQSALDHPSRRRASPGPQEWGP